MDGRICIDGYYAGDGNYELHHHGGEPNPEALCSLMYSIHHNYEVSDLLEMMRKSIQDYIDADCANCEINSINRALQKNGLRPLDEETILVIVREVKHQEALKATKE